MPGRRYIARECLVSAVINGVMSSVAFVIVFGLNPAVRAVPIGQFAADFAVQGAAVGLAATIIPGLLARRAAQQDKTEGRPFGSLPASALLPRALGVAAMAAGVSVALWWSALIALTVAAVPLAVGIAIKAAYGAALAVCCTWSVLEAGRRLPGF